jgi:uncharacterized protein (TIGR02118 family)
MIKVVFCLRRRADMTPEAFHRYWRDVHGPLARERVGLMGACRYVQVRTMDTPGNEALRKLRGGPAPFDGIAEMWWESEDAFRTGIATPEAREAGKVLIDDEANFIDLAASPIWLAYEDEIVPLDANVAASMTKR